MVNRKRLYKCNETFFDDLTLEAPAYWLGFILADGSVRRRSPGRSGELILNISTRDIQHVERFKQDIGFTGPIHHAVGDWGGCGTSYLRITSEHIFQQLISIGIQPRKKYSDMTRFPGLPSVSVRHALRGFLDGDGGIYTQYEEGKPSPSCRMMVSNKSRPLLNDFKTAMHKLCPELVGHGYESQDPRTKVWTFGWRGLNYCGWLADLLYSDCTVALERKLLKAQEIMCESRRFKQRKLRDALALWPPDLRT